MTTPEELRFISDVWLLAAQHYWYMEGWDIHDSTMNTLFWRACAVGEFANIVEETGP
jgi:hypothetical protein